MTKTINRDFKKSYDEKGFFIVDQAYTTEEINRLKEYSITHNHNMKGGVSVLSPESLPDQIISFVSNNNIKEALSQIHVGRTEFLSVKPVYKDNHVDFGTPWHQDWQYWKGMNHKCSVWVALDDVNIENGCLKVIVGSHKVIEEHSHVKQEFGKRIDIIDENERNVIDVIMKKGDALVFHDLLIHGSHPNTSGKDRWSFISTYRDAGIEDLGCLQYDHLWKERFAI